jgi:hypothetical protein
MSTKPTAPEVVAAVSDEDPRIAGKDPSMIPGHPQCNYEKFMAAQPQSIVLCRSDQRNPQFKSLHLTFNGAHSIDVPYDRHVKVPRPYAAMIVLGSLGMTTDEELVRDLEGQIGVPQHAATPTFGPSYGIPLDGPVF